MAELTLYLTERDELPIVTFAQQQLGCKLDLTCTTPRPSTNAWTQLSAYIQYRTRTRVFLISRAFLHHRLELRLEFLLLPHLGIMWVSKGPLKATEGRCKNQQVAMVSDI
jgi:hypothetical protein